MTNTESENRTLKVVLKKAAGQVTSFLYSVKLRAKGERIEKRKGKSSVLKLKFKLKQSRAADADAVLCMCESQVTWVH